MRMKKGDKHGKVRVDDQFFFVKAKSSFELISRGLLRSEVSFISVTSDAYSVKQNNKRVLCELFFLVLRKQNCTAILYHIYYLYSEFTLLTQYIYNFF